MFFKTFNRVCNNVRSLEKFKKKKKDFKTFQRKVNLSYPSPYKSIKKQKKAFSQIKTKENQESRIFPQYGRQFVGRINHSCGQDRSP